jgi:hypothetical protein
MEAIFRLQSNRRLMQRRDEQGREGNSRERQPNSPVVAILDENPLADVIGPDRYELAFRFSPLNGLARA